MGPATVDQPPSPSQDQPQWDFSFFSSCSCLCHRPYSKYFSACAHRTGPLRTGLLGTGPLVQGPVPKGLVPGPAPWDTWHKHDQKHVCKGAGPEGSGPEGPGPDRSGSWASPWAGPWAVPRTVLRVPAPVRTRPSRHQPQLERALVGTSAMGPAPWNQPINPSQDKPPWDFFFFCLHSCSCHRPYSEHFLLMLALVQGPAPKWLA